MKKTLRVSLGQYSSKGAKAVNQDALGACIPKEPLLSTKGITLAVADGVSSSNVSQVASEAAVSSFLQDYYCTSEAWSVRKAAESVISATNSWLYSQTRNGPYRYNREKGYLCTFSAAIFKAHKIHIFHAGDTRVYRVHNNQLEQLTEDHRHYQDSATSYLTSALGMQQNLVLAYRALAVEEGDTFMIASDGVYEHTTPELVSAALAANDDDFSAAARLLVAQALAAGSDDNLSVQLVRVEQLPDQQVGEVSEQITTLPLPPRLQARMTFDGFLIERELYISSRSHVYLASDERTGRKVALKTPSVEMRNDPLYLERFLMEDWIARRIHNPHVLPAFDAGRKRNYLYQVTDYIEGQTLAQWMRDNPQPSLERVRAIIEQIAKGLQAFHRQEMIHQDLRPANVLLDANGTVKIIDFGSTRVAGVAEIRQTHDIQGTAQYTAPEYFVGEEGSTRSDLFSLGVICYHMLSGQLPYGSQVASSHSRAAQRKLRYRPLIQTRSDLPDWIDHTLKKAVHIQPHKRYPVLSEFIYDLRHPNRNFQNQARPPFIERNPVAFWQGVSAILFVICLGLLAQQL